MEIMDTTSTQGFCRGAEKEALPWTNEVYPTDIGPSCSGITSDTGRASAPPVNGNITPTVWNPAKMFTAGTIRSTRISPDMELISIQRTMWVHQKPLSTWGYILGYSGDQTSRWGRVEAPKTVGNQYFDDTCLETDEMTYIFTTGLGDWQDTPGYEVFDINDFVSDIPDAFNIPISFHDYDTYMWPAKAPCLLEVQGLNSGGCASIVEMPSQATAHKLNLFKIDSNKPNQANPTPSLVYGGYDRKNPPGHGPDPAWGRTNLVQIKTVRDVALSS